MQRAIIIKRVLKFDTHLLTRNAVRFRSRYERSINFAIQIKRTSNRNRFRRRNRSKLLQLENVLIGTPNLSYNTVRQTTDFLRKKIIEY